MVQPMADKTAETSERAAGRARMSETPLYCPFTSLNCSFKTSVNFLLEKFRSSKFTHRAVDKCGFFIAA